MEGELKTLSMDEGLVARQAAGAVLADVREIGEFAEGHIPGAAVIDVLQPDFEEKALARLPKDRTIALYCRSGRRSKKAAAVLAENGYTVVELSTGWIGWVNAGKPVEK